MPQPTSASANLANDILNTTVQPVVSAQPLPAAAVYERWVVAIKTSILVTLFNILGIFAVTLAVIYLVHKPLKKLVEGKKPSNTLMIIFWLTAIVSVVVGYTAYKVFLLDTRYGLDISHNLKKYYQDLHNIILNLIPLVLVYILLYKCTDKTKEAQTASPLSAE